jgi:phage tail sheath protein FI
MSVTTTFPGIYVQELPSNAHTIAAAPTSVTVFVGYSHPFKTKRFGTPVELFSFSDYEREFGGFVQSALPGVNDLPYAVNQFFLNGGGDAVVVGLLPAYYNDTPSPPTKTGDITAGQATLDATIVFTARELTDLAPGMTVAITNANGNVADIVVTYGNQQEVFRKVSLDSAKADFLENRINHNLSTLVTVAHGGAGYPATFTNGSQTINTTLPVGTNGIFNPADYTAVFQADTPLDKWPVFNLLLTPAVTDSAVVSEALSFCERKLAFFIMDPPPQDVSDPGTNWIGDFSPPRSQNGALYFPYLQSSDPSTGAPVNVAPSGTVAGVFARTDSNRGVWKAPAGLETIILNTTGVVPTGLMTDPRQGTLNDRAVNCLRNFPGVGTVIFGARTLVYPNTALRTQWGYVPVRRMALFLEQTLKLNLTWAIFEPNDEPLWVAIRTTIESFMLSLFHQGAFAGTKPSDAFQVKCDSTTTTPDDVNNGRVNIIVAFAPLKPAEFVIVKIAQLAGQAQK